MTTLASALRDWRCWVLYGLPYVLALVLRLRLWDAPPFSDEGMTYWLARQWAAVPDWLEHPDGTPSDAFPWPWFYERPAFYLLMGPGALISFDGMRIWHILLASLLAPLSAALLRSHSFARVTSFVVALIVAVHPQFVIFAAVVHMDSVMAVFVLGMLLAVARGRPAWAAGLAALALLTKQYALVFVVTQIGLQLYGWWRAGQPVSRFLAEDRFASALLWPVALGLLPFSIMQEFSWSLTGGPASPQPQYQADHIILLLWFLPLLLLGVFFVRTRRLSVQALSFGTFLFALNVVLERTVREWYRLASALLALIAVAAVLEQLYRSARASRAKWSSIFSPAIAVLLLSLVVVQVGVADHPDKRVWTRPLSRTADPSLEQQTTAESTRQPWEAEMAAWLAQTKPNTGFFIDVRYGLLGHPIPQLVDKVRIGYSASVHLNVTEIYRWAIGIETSDVTVLEKNALPPNAAVRSVYADCVVKETGMYVFIGGKKCAGRFDVLLVTTAENAGSEVPA